MKILFINHTQEKCGVYQYGKRLSDILVLDSRYDLFYSEIDSLQEFIYVYDNLNPDIIVYNWHPSTLCWLNNQTTLNLKNKKQLFIYHESTIPNHLHYDGLIMTDLTENINEKKFSIPRPLFEKKINSINNQIPKIGSFGFGFQNKGFERICLEVQNNFDLASIHLHITNAFFGDKDSLIANRVIKNCKNLINKEGIKLEITTNFMTNDEILNFLNGNTVNMFLYDNLGGRGLSSTIDYAISVDTPLIVNNSHMFRHLTIDKPNISIDNDNILNILNEGLNPVEHFRKKWSNDNLRNKFIKIIEKTC